jgi:hypothetical protein
MKDTWFFWLIILIKVTFFNQVSSYTFNEKGQTQKGSSKQLSQPYFGQVWGEAQHLEKVGIGVVATLAFGLRLRQGG